MGFYSNGNKKMGAAACASSGRDPRLILNYKYSLLPADRLRTSVASPLALVGHFEGKRSLGVVLQKVNVVVISVQVRNFPTFVAKNCFHLSPQECHQRMLGKG